MHLYWLSYSTEPYQCFGTQTRFVNTGSGYFNNGSHVVVGRVEVCINDTYTPVCNDALDQTLAEYICYRSYGYSSKYYWYIYCSVSSYYSKGN